MQTNQRCSLLLHRWVRSKVLCSDRIKGKFFSAATFPQEIDINFIGRSLSRFQEVFQADPLKAQQHIGGFYFKALTTGIFKHQACSLLFLDGGYLEITIFLKKNIHS